MIHIIYSKAAKRYFVRRVARNGAVLSQSNGLKDLKCALKNIKAQLNGTINNLRILDKTNPKQVKEVKL